MARLRVMALTAHENAGGHVHGGFLASLADQSLFVGPAACGFGIVGGVTVDLSCQFLSPGEIGTPLDAVVEVLRETKRMLFARGTIEQEGRIVLSFLGTLRKPG